FQSPAERFVRQRLGALLPEPDEMHPDQLDIALDGLAAWKIGDRYLRGFLAGTDRSVLAGAEFRRGELPPFGFGRNAFEVIEAKARAIGIAAIAHRAGRNDTVDVRVRLSDGRRVYGTVSDVFGDHLVQVNYSKLGAKYRLASWIRLLAMTAGSSAQVAGALTIGGARGKDPGAAISRLTVPGDPCTLLEQLVAIRDAGLRSPFWLPPDIGDEAAQSFGLIDQTGGGKPDRALLRVQRARDFQLKDRYVSWMLYDDPGRSASVDELVGLAGAEPLAAVDGLLPGFAAAGLNPAQIRFIGLAAAIYGPMRAGESSK
ncbi:MAG: exodeoxyribonuclease V subunit gamma, partial [Gordonia sp. (in: high G+C Gram-positive bacteria)]